MSVHQLEEKLEEIKRLVEKLFEEEFFRALAHVKQKHPLLHPHKQDEIARKIARRAVNRYLSENFNMTLDILEQKIMAEEIDVSLEDLAV